MNAGVRPRSLGMGAAEWLIFFTGERISHRVLGVLPKNPISELLGANYAMQRDEIPIRLVEFAKVLENNRAAVHMLLEFILDSFFLKLHMERSKWTDLNEGIQATKQIIRDNFAQEMEL
jgi:hypothetical protein